MLKNTSVSSRAIVRSDHLFCVSSVCRFDHLCLQKVFCCWNVVSELEC